LGATAAQTIRYMDKPEYENIIKKANKKTIVERTDKIDFFSKKHLEKFFKTCGGMMERLINLSMIFKQIIKSFINFNAKIKL